MPNEIITGRAFGRGVPLERKPEYNDTQFRSRPTDPVFQKQNRLGDGAVVANSSTRSSLGLMTHRGFMTTPPGVKPKIVFNFMYNPNEINSAYDIDQSAIAPELLQELSEEAYGGVNNLVGGASISFTLLLDRTVEHAHRVGSSSQTGAARLGVMHDLAVFERLVGELSSGKIVSRPIEVHFNRSYLSALNFVGYITGCSIFFGGPNGLFSDNMVPTRCSMSIVMRRIFVPDPSEVDRANTDPTKTVDPKTGETKTKDTLTGTDVQNMTDEQWRDWMKQQGLNP